MPKFKVKSSPRKQRVKTRFQTVQLSGAALLRWINEFEQDALELTGCGDPDDIDESREVIALRAAVLKKLVKNFGDVFPNTLKVAVRVDP